jgi:hypothetical protein
MASPASALLMSDLVAADLQAEAVNAAQSIQKGRAINMDIECGCLPKGGKKCACNVEAVRKERRACSTVFTSAAIISFLLLAVFILKMIGSGSFDPEGVLYNSLLNVTQREIGTIMNILNNVTSNKRTSF